MLPKPLLVTPKMPLKFGVSVPADGWHAGSWGRSQAHLRGVRSSRPAAVMGEAGDMGSRAAGVRSRGAVFAPSRLWPVLGEKRGPEGAQRRREEGSNSM